MKIKQPSSTLEHQSINQIKFSLNLYTPAIMVYVHFYKIT